MKTVSQTISLSDELAQFANAEAREGGYGSVSAYFADLLRDRRQAAEQSLAEEFQKLSADGAAGRAPVEKIVATVRRVRKQMRGETKRAA